MSRRKKRSDCKMNRLTDEQREGIFALSQTLSLDALVEKIESEFDFDISRQALSLWLASERLTRKVARQVEIADGIAEAARAANGGKLDAAIDAAVKARALDAIQSADDPEVVSELVKCVLSMRKTDLDSRRLELLEKKAAMADKAEAVVKTPKLSDEERSRRIKEIFHIV